MFINKVLITKLIIINNESDLYTEPKIIYQIKFPFLILIVPTTVPSYNCYNKSMFFLICTIVKHFAALFYHEALPQWSKFLAY